ncbi:site-specific DNA-methyltransferase [Candidatus Woesearchaeota archaeon]|nr:site-specific DNA-methyltransferase [Candidatus Woesearchaeota archaeon]
MKITSNYSKDSDVTLYHGDTVELLKNIPDKEAMLIVTSPPYNIGKEYEKVSSLENYLKQQEEVIKQCVRVLNEKGSICWQVGNHINGEVYPLDILLYPIFKKYGLHLRNRIIWTFGHGLHASKRFSGRHETILWFTKNEDYHFNLDPIRVPQKYPQKKHYKGNKKGQLSGNPLGKNPSDVWEIPNVKSNHPEKTEHPCQFPIELVERLLLSMTKEKDLVIDPFMGVGSTAIASVRNNRRSAGADTMKKYLDIAKDRLRTLEKGELVIREIGTPIYDPNAKLKDNMTLI